MKTVGQFGLQNPQQMGFLLAAGSKLITQRHRESDVPTITAQSGSNSHSYSGNLLQRA